MARSRNTADTQTASGGPVSPSIAGKNAIINGGMDIWQRGTSFNNPSSAYYTADRFQGMRHSQVSGITISRQVTGDTTNLPFIQYCARISRDSGNTSTNALYFGSCLETINSIPLAGRTVTFSFYARKGLNYSPTSDALNVKLISGTGTDQNNTFTGNYTGSADVISQTATLTSTWQRFSYSATVGATATELQVLVFASPTGTAGANDYYEITGFQLELGSVATPFSRAGGTIQGELAACQRYYWRTSNATAYASHGSGNAYSTTASVINIINPVPMRVAATSVDSSNLRLDDNVSTFTFSSLTLNSSVLSSLTTTVNVTGASGMTQYRFYNLSNNNNTAGYIGFSAEL